MTVRSMIESWERFRQGKFWEFYEAFFEKERKANLTHLGDCKEADFGYMKFLQGINEGFKRARLIPNKVVQELEKEVEKESK